MRAALTHIIWSFGSLDKSFSTSWPATDPRVTATNNTTDNLQHISPTMHLMYTTDDKGNR